VEAGVGTSLVGFAATRGAKIYPRTGTGAGRRQARGVGRPLSGAGALRGVNVPWAQALCTRRTREGNPLVDDAETLKELEQVYETDYEIGQDNVRPAGLDLHNPVFFWSASLILLFVLISLLIPARAKEALEGARDWVINSFDWLLLSSGSVFVLFCVALILLPLGRIRIGGADARPDYSRMSWFAMLFAAGMGIGLMFWSVAEPVGYFTEWFGSPLNIAGGTEESKTAALGATMYHWGMHPWAIYSVVALSLAFFTYNKGLPLTIRSTFYPLLGDRVWGPIGHVIDTLAVFATIFGLATSLGFGAQQASGGLDFLFGIPATLLTQVIIIAVVTAIAVGSVVPRCSRSSSSQAASSPSCRTPARRSPGTPSTSCRSATRSAARTAPSTTAGRSSSGLGGSRGPPSSGCSSPGCPGAAPSGSSSRPCSSCRPSSRRSG
jgi:hypothetical protein